MNRRQWAHLFDTNKNGIDILLKRLHPHTKTAPEQPRRIRGKLDNKLCLNFTQPAQPGTFGSGNKPEVKAVHNLLHRPLSGPVSLGFNGPKQKKHKPLVKKKMNLNGNPVNRYVRVPRIDVPSVEII